MTKVICIAHQKGGVGKSTLCLNLAFFFKNGLNVSIIDADVQGSLIGLDLSSDGLDLLAIEKIRTAIEENTHDILIIDTPPYISDKLPGLFALSDFILIPTKAGIFDLMAVRSTLAMVTDAIGNKNSLKAGIVFNMVKHNSSISHELKGMLNQNSIPILKSIITERVSYTRSVIDGGVLNTSDEKAKNEIANLADEILKHLGL